MLSFVVEKECWFHCVKTEMTIFVAVIGHHGNYFG